MHEGKALREVENASQDEHGNNGGEVHRGNGDVGAVNPPGTRCCCRPVPTPNDASNHIAQAIDGGTLRIFPLPGLLVRSARCGGCSGCARVNLFVYLVGNLGRNTNKDSAHQQGK